MKFSVEWNFLKFNTDQGYAETPEDELEHAITTTGRRGNSAESSSAHNGGIYATSLTTLR
jgi:hypothetical protein